MNKILIKILLIVCFAFQLRGQVYDLNKFKYRYQQYYFLQTNYDLANKIDFLKSGIEPNRFLPNVSRVDFNLAGSIAGQRFFNLDKKRLFENFSLVAGENNAYEQSFPFNPNDLNNILLQKSTQRNATFQANYSKTITKYYDKKFISLDYNGNFYNYKSNKRYIDSALKSSMAKKMLGFGATLGIGRGRLESVDDAVAAVFLLEDLKKNKIIESYTEEQVENIAKSIVRARNARFIGDIRFQVIDRIAIVDSACKENQIIAKNQLKFYSTLYDNFYFNNSFFSRKTGQILENYLGFNEKVEWSKSLRTATTDEKSKQANSYIYYRFNYSNYKQKSQKIERGYSLGIASSFKLDSTKYSNITPSISYSYLIQPNSRTFLSFIPTISVSKVNDRIDKLNQVTFYNLYMTMKYNRFISRKASLYIDSSLLLTYLDKRIKQDFLSNFNFNSGISYTFF